MKYYQNSNQFGGGQAQPLNPQSIPPTSQGPNISPQQPFYPAGPTSSLNYLFRNTSYVENILRQNKGSLVTVYTNFNMSGYNPQAFTGILEGAGLDHVLIRDPKTNKHYLILQVYVLYYEFPDDITYFYPFDPDTYPEGIPVPDFVQDYIQYYQFLKPQPENTQPTQNNNFRSPTGTPVYVRKHNQ